MNVKELIAKLEAINQDMPVRISVSEWVGGPYDTDQSCETFEGPVNSVEIVHGRVVISDEIPSPPKPRVPRPVSAAEYEFLKRLCESEKESQVPAFRLSKEEIEKCRAEMESEGDDFDVNRDEIPSAKL